tara:strand:+ start:51901 stop:52395 length:495 start_codon:yes stop_codon:yes gene_type:complete
MTGMGGIGMGPMNEMDDDFDLDMGDEGDDDMDLGGDEGGLDLGGDEEMGDMGDDLGAEEEESVTCTRQEFEDAVMSAVDSAWGALAGGGDEGGLDLGGDEMGGLEADGDAALDLDDTEEGLDDFGGGEEVAGECYGESVNRIANLLTEDPDVFSGRRPRPRRRR